VRSRSTTTTRSSRSVSSERASAGAVTLSNNAKLADTGAISHATYITGVVAVNNNLQLDVTRAHDISCCVQTAGLSATGNKTTACQGNHYCINNGQQACFDN
jgi:hypothetical protein